MSAAEPNGLTLTAAQTQELLNGGEVLVETVYDGEPLHVVVKCVAAVTDAMRDRVIELYDESRKV
jgi:hypothetical protein